MSSSFADNNMSKEWDEMNVTHGEFNQVCDALKNDEFRKMFFEYCEEMQDPENQKKFQEELIQLEAERGVSITFLNPIPGFVIKSSVDGKSKCFINVAQNDKIDKPSNEVKYNESSGKKEISWKLPYAQAPPRHDYDNKQVKCLVYDVIFHPDALHLAERNSMLRNHLINTACDAVEREFKAKLDRTNLKFPKLKYKGVAKPTVSRKLMENQSTEPGEPSPFEEFMPPKPEFKTGEDAKPKIYKGTNFKAEKYATPKYVIKHRRGIDMSELTYELDAKLNLTIPKELVIEIALPLLKTTSDCTLDVTEKKLYLISEKPAKYQLHIDLPFPVNDKNGTAKFDKTEKKLTVILPVCSERERKLKDIYREDSGVESDIREEHFSLDSPTRNDSPALIEILNSTENEEIFNNKSDTKTDNENSFLKDTIQYNIPQNFDCNVLDSNLVFVLHVKNVDPQSIEHQSSNNFVHLKFISIGAGYYPIHYSFYCQLPENYENNKIEKYEAEAWDNNVILTLVLNNSENLQEYSAGLNENNLKRYEISGNFDKFNQLAIKSDLKLNEIENHKFNIELKRCKQSNQIELEIKSKDEFSEVAESTEDEKLAEKYNKKEITENGNVGKKNKKKNNKKRRSYSESACDDLKSFRITTPPITDKYNKKENDSEKDDSKDENSISVVGGRKQRSFSESRSLSECTPSFKGILKHYSRYGRSISESCSDDQLSCSVDNLRPADSFSDIPEEGIDDDDASAVESGHSLSESCKKTVRFSEVIHKQLFRLDSSILGQKKKNQKRKNQKQRAIQRRNSEGDSADYDEKSPTSGTLLQKKKTKRSTSESDQEQNDAQSEIKTQLKRADSESSDIESKNSLIFDFEI